MEDIEVILQQYGIDRRQQQDAAARIRHIARRQRSALAAAACSIVILVTTVWSVQRLATPEMAENITIAWQSVSVPQFNIPLQTIHSTTDKRSIVGKSFVAPASTIDRESGIAETPSDKLYAERKSEQQSDTTNQTEQIDNDIQPASTPQILFTQSDIVPITAAESATELQVPESDSRFNFIASVGAFAMSQLGAGSAGEFYMNDMIGFEENEISYTSVTPINSFSANVGVTYTVLKQEKFASRVGLVVSGQAQQGSIMAYELEPASGFGIDGGIYPGYQLVENPDRRESFNVFSLYAGIPFVVDMQPLGNGKAGWSLSLTPAHTIFTPRILGNARSGVFVPNPWKLTVGVGVSLPRRFPRMVSFNANLLSVSKSLSLHEVGIEIGF